MNDDVDDPNMKRPEDLGQVSEPLRRAIGERYLTYALSTIMHRALPDARDGLKPVHRRILYAMRELRLTSTGGFRKSAKIGDPYAMRRLYALRRQCSFICARIVGQQTATAPANFKNNPHRPFDRPAPHNRRA